MPADPPLQLPGVREAIATVNALVGCVHSLTPADTGLFGPASMSWRAQLEPGFAISSIAALLLQALNPVAMAAIDQHSDFRRDPWRRGRRTTDYLFTITFSARAQAEAAAARVRAIHARVAGTDPLTGRAYRADDPDLLLWVHNAATVMALAGHQRFGRGFTPAEADRFVAEQVLAAALIGLDPTQAPDTRAKLAAALDAAELRLSPAAAAFADSLIRARMPLAMRPFWALHVAGAIALLPERARNLYDFPSWLRRASRLRLPIRAVLRAMDLGYSLFPDIRRARRHLAAIARAAP